MRPDGVESASANPLARIALAQINPTVGAVPGNSDKVAARLQEAKRAGAALMVTPELALSGYPPEDLLFHRGFRRRIDEALARLADSARGIDLLVGYPEYSGGVLFNAAACPLVPATVALGVPAPAVSPPLPAAAASGLVAGSGSPSSAGGRCKGARSIEHAASRHSAASTPRITSSRAR